jgi:hypothetical protein
MSLFTDAVSWSGRGVTLSLFAVFAPDCPAPELEHVRGQVPAASVRTYLLEDLDKRLGGLRCYEYDLVFDAVPPDPDALVAAWLRSALDAGAEVAWFAFEGSFDFDHILTADVASQVFAVGSGAGIELAIEDAVRTAAAWATRVVDVREKAGL